MPWFEIMGFGQFFCCGKPVAIISYVEALKERINKKFMCNKAVVRIIAS
ncbi:MAG: hypothetical protein ACJAU1_000989 [Psychromonas sp.]|jgi:hypothetical protein